MAFDEPKTTACCVKSPCGQRDSGAGTWPMVDRRSDDVRQMYRRRGW